MKKIITLLFIFATQISIAGVAIVLSTTNKVTAQQGSQARVLTRGSALNVADAVSTAKGAMAHIKYNNGTIVTIGENSLYTILAFSPKQSDVQIKAELSKGSMALTTTGKSKESLKSPVIAMAILGTQAGFYVKSPKATYFTVISGSVSARNRIFGPGSSELATETSIVSAPFPLPNLIIENSKVAEAEGISGSGANQGESSNESTTGTKDKEDVMSVLSSTVMAGNDISASMATSTQAAIAVQPPIT